MLLYYLSLLLMFASQIYSHAYLFVCVEVCIVCFVYLFVCMRPWDYDSTPRRIEWSNKENARGAGWAGLEWKKGAGEFLNFRVNAQKSWFHKNIQRRLLVCRDDQGDEIIFVQSARRSRIFFRSSYLAIFNGYAK